MNRPDALWAAAKKLCAAVEPLRFGAPVTHVYNPLRYAGARYRDYLRKYAAGPKRVVYLGVNPGPWGMAQTGIPFGEIRLVRDFLGIEGPVGKPPREHPKRPIVGFDCARSEVSGARLWGAIAARYGDAGAFFAHGFVANYCPLVFMEDSGRNRTPDKLPASERDPLYAACDRHLAELVRILEPEWVIGVGKFAEKRARATLDEHVRVASILHPSPASPAANRDWAAKVDQQLSRLGLCGQHG